MPSTSARRSGSTKPDWVRFSPTDPPQTRPSEPTCPGAEQFSVAAWPTLHKDVDLAHELGVDTHILLDAAASTIAEMNRRRGGGTSPAQ